MLREYLCILIMGGLLGIDIVSRSDGFLLEKISYTQTADQRLRDLAVVDQAVQVAQEVEWMLILVHDLSEKCESFDLSDEIRRLMYCMK